MAARHAMMEITQIATVVGLIAPGWIIFAVMDIANAQKNATVPAGLKTVFSAQISALKSP
jgi:hypothetical protein